MRPEPTGEKDARSRADLAMAASTVAGAERAATTDEALEVAAEAAAAATAAGERATTAEPAPAPLALPPGISLAAAIEAVLLVSNEPCSIRDLERLIEGASRGEITAALRALRESYRARAAAGETGLEIVEMAGGFRLLSRPELAPWVERVETITREERLSRAALETLAIVAYKQPIVRAEVDAIRGVDSSAPLRSLVDRGLVKAVGRADTPGRPLKFGTTPRFLERFGLANLSDLPQRDKEPARS